MSDHEETVEFKFDMGRLLLTLGARDGLSPDDIILAVNRHGTGDWGDRDPPDKALNDLALADGEGRLFSAYSSFNGTRFYVVTEADRSVTTIMLPHEY